MSTAPTKIICPGCGKIGTSNRVVPDGTKVRCRCGHAFLHSETYERESPPPPPPPSTTPNPIPAPSTPPPPEPAVYASPWTETISRHLPWLPTAIERLNDKLPWLLPIAIALT